MKKFKKDIVRRVFPYMEFNNEGFVSAGESFSVECINAFGDDV